MIHSTDQDNSLQPMGQQGPVAAGEVETELDIQRWMRNFRSGLTANLILAILTLVYLLATLSDPYRGVLIAITTAFLAGLIILCTIPARRIAVLSWRTSFFHSWTVLCLCVTFIVVWADGGVESPVLLYLYMIMLFTCQAYTTRSSAVFAGIGLAGYCIVAMTQPSDPGLGSHRLFTLALLAAAYGFSIAIVYSRDALARDNSRLRQKLTAIANHDPVTGCPNRWHFLQCFQLEIARYSTRQTPLSLLLIDVDFFKSINDQYGHLEGDNILRHIGEALCHVTRQTDTPGRLGGDEFVLLAPDTDAADAIALAERLRTHLAALPLRCKVTLSIGICTGKGSHQNSPETFMEYADKALYDVKRNGRNAVKALPCPDPADSTRDSDRA